MKMALLEENWSMSCSFK